MALSCHNAAEGSARISQTDTTTLITHAGPLHHFHEPALVISPTLLTTLVVSSALLTTLVVSSALLTTLVENEMNANLRDGVVEVGATVLGLVAQNLYKGGYRHPKELLGHDKYNKVFNLSQRQDMNTSAQYYDIDNEVTKYDVTLLATLIEHTCDVPHNGQLIKGVKTVKKIRNNLFHMRSNNNFDFEDIIEKLETACMSILNELGECRRINLYLQKQSLSLKIKELKEKNKILNPFKTYPKPMSYQTYYTSNSDSDSDSDPTSSYTFVTRSASGYTSGPHSYSTSRYTSDTPSTSRYTSGQSSKDESVNWGAVGGVAAVAALGIGALAYAKKKDKKKDEDCVVM